MSVKIGSVGLSDVVIGSSGGGKTNIDKIVVGNADGTGTVLWQRVTPTEGGSWSGYIYYNEVFLSEYYETFWLLYAGSSYFVLRFEDGKWLLNSEPIQSGTGAEKYLEKTEFYIYLIWSA